MIKTGFSFNYGGERKYFDNAGTYKIDDNLTITCIRRDFKKYGAADWVIYFENTGNENTGIISDVLDCDTTVAVKHINYPRVGLIAESNYPALIWQKGCVSGSVYNYDDITSAEEFRLHKVFFHPAYPNGHSFQNITARSSDGTTPFFTVIGDGNGAVIAVGWTGGWKADLVYDNAGNVSVKTGLQAKTNFYLEPGEKIRTSSVLIMEFSENDDIDYNNKFRRLVREHFSHTACTDTQREGILAFELWGGLPSTEMIKRLTELKKYDIKLEDLWIDAGWYGQCNDCNSPYNGDWSKFAGEWEINRRVHPALFQDVKKAANDAGLNMMLWFEPERATNQVPMVTKHPEYFLPSGNNFILNYGNEKAREYIYETLSSYIENLGMSCYRQDFNTALDKVFAEADAEDRQGITEIKHICGMYELWDRLLTRFPGLLIDNCASGGRRIDIETIRRSTFIFRSDYQVAFNSNGNVYQAHNSGISSYLPYNGCSTKVKNDIYNVRSSYSSSWGVACYNAVFQEMSEDDFMWLKKTTDEYIRIRKYLSCDFYSLASNIYDLTSWSVWQYNDADTNSGIVMAFRRDKSPFEKISVKLKGIKSGSVVEFENLNDGSKTQQKIYDKDTNFEITLPERKSSVIYEYKIIQ